MQHQSVLFGRHAPDQSLIGGTTVLIRFGHIAETPLADATFGLTP